jgi:hypothetical protein
MRCSRSSSRHALWMTWSQAFSPFILHPVFYLLRTGQSRNVPRRSLMADRQLTMISCGGTQAIEISGGKQYRDSFFHSFNIPKALAHEDRGALLVPGRVIWSGFRDPTASTAAAQDWSYSGLIQLSFSLRSVPVTGSTIGILRRTLCQDLNNSGSGT